MCVFPLTWCFFGVLLTKVILSRAMGEELRDVRGRLPLSSDKSDFDLEYFRGLEDTLPRYKNKYVLGTSKNIIYIKFFWYGFYRKEPICFLEYNEEFGTQNTHPPTEWNCTVFLKVTLRANSYNKEPNKRRDETVL